MNNKISQKLEQSIGKVKDPDKSVHKTKSNYFLANVSVCVPPESQPSEEDALFTCSSICTKL